MILGTVNSLIHTFFTWGVSRICEWISTRMTCKFTKNRAIINYYNIKSIPFNVISAIWYKLPTDHAYIKSLAFKQTPHGETRRACSLAIKCYIMKTFYLTSRVFSLYKELFSILAAVRKLEWAKKSMLHVGMLGTQASTPKAVETYSKLTQFV